MSIPKKREIVKSIKKKQKAKERMEAVNSQKLVNDRLVKKTHERNNNNWE